MRNGAKVGWWKVPLSPFWDVILEELIGNDASPSSEPTLTGAASDAVPDLITHK